MVTPVFAACDGVFILMAGPVLSVVTLATAVSVLFPALSVALAYTVAVPDEGNAFPCITALQLFCLSFPSFSPVPVSVFVMLTALLPSVVLPILISSVSIPESASFTVPVTVIVPS